MNKADLEEKQERRMRYGFLALLLLVLGGIHFMDPAFYPTVYQLSKSGDLGGTITYLRGFGVYAVFVSFLLMSLSILLDFFRLFYFYCQWPDFWFVLGDDDFMAGRNIRRYDFFLGYACSFPKSGKAGD